MSSDLEVKRQPKWMFWTGHVLSVVLVLLLLFSATMKLLKPPELLAEFARFGYADRLALGIGLVEMACAVLYLIPRTSVLGAILLTGYLGGAVATHVRVEDPAGSLLSPVIIGMVVWLALFLRDARVRELIPLRR